MGCQFTCPVLPSVYPPRFFVDGSLIGDATRLLGMGWTELRKTDCSDVIDLYLYIYNCLVVFRHPSEKSQFVSWDDDSIPNCFWKVIKMFQSPPTSYKIPMDIPIFWVNSSESSTAHDRPTGGVSFTEKTSSVWTWPRSDLNIKSGDFHQENGRKWGVPSNS